MEQTNSENTRFNNMISMFNCNHAIKNTTSQVIQDKIKLEQKLNELENEVFHKLLFTYIVEHVIHMTKPSYSLGSYLTSNIISCNYSSDQPSICYQWVCNTNNSLSEANECILVKIVENNMYDNHATIQINYLNLVRPGSLANAYCTVVNNVKIMKHQPLSELLNKHLI